MKFSSTLKTSVQRWLNHLFQNQSPFFCCLLFFKEYINLQIKVNQMVSKQCQGTPQSFKTNFRSILSNFHKLLRALSLSRIFVENLFWLLENAFTSQKYESRYFQSCPSPDKTLPQVNIIPPGSRKLLIPTVSCTPLVHIKQKSLPTPPHAKIN